MKIILRGLERRKYITLTFSIHILQLSYEFKYEVS